VKKSSADFLLRAVFFIFFILSTGCSHLMSQPESSATPPVSQSGESIDSQLRKHYPQLEQLKLDLWPSGSGHVSGLLKRLEMRIPSTDQTQAQVREQLREHLNAILVAQQHPASDCIAISASLLEGFWQLQADIVCL
jgi:hypothetical protein